MKKLNLLKTACGFLCSLMLLSACDKFEDDQAPDSINTLVVHNDNFTTSKNQGIQVNVLANDSIGSQATVNFTQPQHGTIQAGASGTVSYHPELNFVGTDQFSYTACLGNNCATGQVTISVIDSTAACAVSAANDIDTVMNKRHQSVTINILRNDNACGGTPGILQQPAHGQAYLNPSHQLVYAPAAGYLGSDQVKYQITGQNGTATALVNILVVDSTQTTTCTVVAQDDNSHVPYNGSATVNILQNDNTCSGNPSIAMFPSHGQAYLNANKQIVYTPHVSYHGTDQLTYTISGPNGNAVARVYFSVAAPACIVKANNDNASVYTNNSVTVNILQNDNTCAGTTYLGTPSILNQPLHGQAYLNANKQLVYTPSPNYVGPDEITYNLNSTGGGSFAKVFLTVMPAQPPVCNLVARYDSATLQRSITQTYDSISVAVLRNDTYCQNGTVPTVQIIQQPQYGNAMVVSTGLNTRIVYSTIAAPTNATDRIRYRICQTINNQQTCSDANLDIHIQ